MTSKEVGKGNLYRLYIDTLEVALNFGNGINDVPIQHRRRGDINAQSMETVMKEKSGEGLEVKIPTSHGVYFCLFLKGEINNNRVF